MTGRHGSTRAWTEVGINRGRINAFPAQCDLDQRPLFTRQAPLTGPCLGLFSSNKKVPRQLALTQCRSWFLRKTARACVSVGLASTFAQDAAYPIAVVAQTARTSPAINCTTKFLFHPSAHERSIAPGRRFSLGLRDMHVKSAYRSLTTPGVLPIENAIFDHPEPAHMAQVDKPKSFQEIILRLQTYWAANGCAILQPYDMEVGAGTFHPATTLRALGGRAWAAAYVQPSRRPTDGRYGENPNRLQHYYQYQVLIKPSPPNLQELYLGSLEAIGIDMSIHDIRFVEDDWESPTLGAWGLGWEVWCDGMEVSQFTYFQQVGGHDCHPVSGELTYGLERLAMYVLGVDHVMDMPFNDPQSPIALSYGDVFKQTEQEYSRWNFDVADTDILLQHFKDAEAECKRILDQEQIDPKTGQKIIMAHPAYDQCIKASHLFNLLDARGVISVTERQAYIGRVRALAKACADAFVQTDAAGAAA